ncbi:MAG: TIGR03032 family protein [Gammaproteobacteria bacterium]|nr:TIGR03032 family protein [Gammaproteobacteria bacterium]
MGSGEPAGTRSPYSAALPTGRWGLPHHRGRAGVPYRARPHRGRPPDLPYPATQGTVRVTRDFTPLWQPPFLTRLAAEDRCHLNGLALQGGVPRYVTAVGQSDVADGWREHRAGGGLLLDVERNETILAGLSMPHSPRRYRERLWLLDSGRGQLGSVDLARGVFEPLTFCPGYARGLAFHGDYALVGISRARQNRTFAGLALDAALEAKGAEARTGILVIDMRSGDTVHWLRLTGVIEELYDVAMLPGVVRPMALGFRSDEVQRLITVGPGALFQFTK